MEFKILLAGAKIFGVDLQRGNQSMLALSRRIGDHPPAPKDWFTEIIVECRNTE